MKGISKRFPCRDCGATNGVRGSGGNLGLYMCDNCREKSGRKDLNAPPYIAHREVARARKRGELPDPRSLPCADCGIQAIEYDHRDYSKPLKVDAVCRGCNIRRGPAIGHITKSAMKASSEESN